MLAAGILPLASGTAPAAKGCVMEMVTPEKKGDALSAIALIEVRFLLPLFHFSLLLVLTLNPALPIQTLAMISTVSLFGSIFAQLSELGRPNDVFFLNAVRPVHFLLTSQLSALTNSVCVFSGNCSRRRCGSSRR